MEGLCCHHDLAAGSWEPAGSLELVLRHRGQSDQARASTTNLVAAACIVAAGDLVASQSCQNPSLGH